MTSPGDPRRQFRAVAIVGMGRVGLPLAVGLARGGLRVMCLEADAGRRETIELGKSPFHEPGTAELLPEQVSSGRLTLHADPADVVPHVDAVVLCVPTPLGADLRADYHQLLGALDGLIPFLRPGQLLVLRSTVSPGTLWKVVLPYLRERAPDVADSLLLAACPERIAEGRAMEELLTLPEIVGGIDEASTDAAAQLFRMIDPNKRIHRTDPTSAELAKLFTNVYRYVNFALANEFAILAEHYQADAHHIISMLNEEYPRANVPRPGPAGGPCLSKDGYFLVEELTLPDFVLLAWKLNDSIPSHIVRRLARNLERCDIQLQGSPVAVLGRSFKRDSDDPRQSPAERVATILLREGADVRVHDPYFAGPSIETSLSAAKAFVLATNHSAYDRLEPSDVASWMDPPRIGMDCWGVLDRAAFEEAGVKIITFGVGEEL